MKSVDIPVKFQAPFAYQADPSRIATPVPLTTSSPGRISLSQGFPQPTFEPVASGGNPPYGKDMNGVLYQSTAWLQWAAAGGFPTAYDSAFSSAIGGYPKGALLEAATWSDLTGALYWVSAVDDNATNPDAGGANWIAFPGRNVQLQKPNYAVDSGAINAAVLTLSPAPTSWAQITGTPIRFKIAFTNTITSPTININGIGAKTMINSDGTALAVGQLVAGRIVEGFPCDDDKFQVNSPPKAATTSPWKPGQIITWPTETPPSGTLECSGAIINIADFPNLFAVIGTRYGGDGITTFALPNYRGEFLRGWDHGRGLDPNAATRTNAGGGATGDHVGTNQLGAAGPISITGGSISINDPLFNTPEHGPLPLNQVGSDIPPQPAAYGNLVYEAEIEYRPFTQITGSITISGTSGAPESRPVNIYVMYCIAY